jgi:hypothetical protein
MLPGWLDLGLPSQQAILSVALPCRSARLDDGLARAAPPRYPLFDPRHESSSLRRATHTARRVINIL